MTHSNWRAAVARFGRFGVVGASGTAVNMTLFWTFTTALNVPYLIAGPLAFELSFLGNYALHNVWTFSDRRSRFLSTTLARCQLVSAVALALNLTTLFVCVNNLGLPTILGNLVGIALATAWNFALSLRWTWQARLPQTRATRQRNHAPLAA